MTATRSAAGGWWLLRLRGPILICHLYQACAFSLLALPVLEATRASGIGQFPEPARQLFSDGALWLLELITQQKSSLLASVGPGLWLFGLACGLALLPECWLLRAIVREHTATAPPVRPVLTRLAALGLVVWLLRLAAWLALAGLASSELRGELVSSERSADLLLLGGLGLTLLWQFGLSLLRDLAALGIVWGPRAALGTLRQAPPWILARSARLMARYAAVRALCFGTWLGGELLLFVLPSAVTAGTGAALAVHQLALFARVLLHAAWLDWLARQLEL